MYYCCQKRWFFAKKKKKNAGIKKTKRALVLNFLKLYVCVYLRTKLQVSSIILTSFRQGEGIILPRPRQPFMKFVSSFDEIHV